MLGGKKLSRNVSRKSNKRNVKRSKPRKSRKSRKSKKTRKSRKTQKGGKKKKKRSSSKKRSSKKRKSKKNTGFNLYHGNFEQQIKKYWWLSKMMPFIVRDVEEQSHPLNIIDKTTKLRILYNMIKKLHSDSVIKVTPFSAEMFKLLGLSKVMAEYTLNKPLQQQSMNQKTPKPSTSSKAKELIDICNELVKSTKRTDIEKAIRECKGVLPLNEIEKLITIDVPILKQAAKDTPRALNRTVSRTPPPRSRKDGSKDKNPELVESRYGSKDKNPELVESRYGSKDKNPELVESRYGLHPNISSVK